MRQITKAEWTRKEHHGYTAIINGVKHILTSGERGTTLEPVEVK